MNIKPISQNNPKISLHKPKNLASVTAKKVSNLMKSWEHLSYSQIAKEITVLKDQGADVREPLFQYRFPLVQDLKHFAKNIRFEELTPHQLKEVMRLARKGG